MPDAHRTTVCLDPELLAALRSKSAATGRSVSGLVNDAVRAVLAEDIEDLRAFDESAGEPVMSLDEFLRLPHSHGRH